jgi:hypothetical protein
MGDNDSVKTKSGKAQERQWCPECRKYVLAVRPGTNRIIHLLLSVLTMGVWLIVWACTADLGTRKPCQCPVCGTQTQEMADSEAGDEPDSPHKG